MALAHPRLQGSNKINILAFPIPICSPTPHNCTHIKVRTCMCMYIYVHVYIYMHIYIYIYTYIYIHAGKTSVYS